MSRKKKLETTEPRKAKKELSVGQRVYRLEVLSQAEALVHAGLTHALHLGYGDVFNWPAMITRPEGTTTYPFEAAIDMAADRIIEVAKNIGAEILALEGSPPDAERKRYKVEEPHSNDHPRTPETRHPTTPTPSDLRNRRKDRATEAFPHSPPTNGLPNEHKENPTRQ